MDRLWDVGGLTSWQLGLATALGLVLVSVLRFSYKFYQQRSFFRDLPKPPHSFIWGHLRLLGEVAATMPPNVHPQAFYTQIRRKYGLDGPFYLDLWPLSTPQVIVSDPEGSDYLTIVKPTAAHVEAQNFLAPIVGRENIAVVNGPMWKKLHNAMAPSFSWSHIRSLTGVFVDECIVFRSVLDRFAASGEVFSMEELSMKLIFDVIAIIVFNFRLDAQTKGSQELLDLRGLVDLSTDQLDVAAMLNPIYRFKLWRRRNALLGRLHPWLIAKIRERLTVLRSTGLVPSRKNPNSVLDLMLRETIQSDEQSTGKGQALDALPQSEIDLLVTNIKALLLGGQGTTSDSLCAMLMLLSKAPEVVKKLRDEHTYVLDKDLNTTIEILLNSPEKLQELPYTDAVIKESLRLFPVGFSTRAAEDGTYITHNGQQLPVGHGLSIALHQHGLHYNPKYFSEPSKFRPERWLDPEHEIPRSYFRSFGKGQRACLGQNLATNELKIILIMTMRDYDFEMANLKPNKKPRTLYTDLDLVYGDIIFQELALSAKPAGGTMMTVKRRSEVQVSGGN